MTRTCDELIRPMKRNLSGNVAQNVCNPVVRNIHNDLFPVKQQDFRAFSESCYRTDMFFVDEMGAYVDQNTDFCRFPWVFAVICHVDWLYFVYKVRLRKVTPTTKKLLGSTFHISLLKFNSELVLGGTLLGDLYGKHLLSKYI